MTKSFDYGSTNRLSILQCDKIYNKLGNKLQSLNIPTCEVNIISKIKLQKYREKNNFKNTKISNFSHQNRMIKFAFPSHTKIYTQMSQDNNQNIKCLKMMTTLKIFDLLNLLQN
jgi:hypothetical protein